MRRFLTLFLLAVGAWAQTPAGPSPDTLALPSPYLSAGLRAEVHLPADYAASPAQHYPVCLLLHGGGGSAANLRELGLAELATLQEIIIVVPDAGPSLFVNAIKDGGERLESAILNTLLPEIDRRYRTVGTRVGRRVVGLSFGGYAALRFGILHPDYFSFAAAMSGVVEAPRWTALEEALLPEKMRDQMAQAFGPAGSDQRRRQDLFTLLEALPPEARRALPLLSMTCGTEDIFLPANQRFATLLLNLGIRHEFRPSPGQHDGTFWRRELCEVMRRGNQPQEGFAKPYFSP